MSQVARLLSLITSSSGKLLTMMWLEREEVWEKDCRDKHKRGKYHRTKGPATPLNTMELIQFVQFNHPLTFYDLKLHFEFNHLRSFYCRQKRNDTKLKCVCGYRI